MKLRGLIDEDFTQYKKPSMFLIAPYCNFKCCLEAGNKICQNMEVVKDPIIEIYNGRLIDRYLSNPITKAIVFGGLEPMDSFEEVYEFIDTLRFEYSCFDDVVIYTGYNADEIIDQWMRLSKFDNVIIKFGRFVPDQPSHFDEVLGVKLASPNQYAVKL